jgi:hypothetical protein
MTLSKAGKLSLLACLLLIGFAGASYGAVRFDVVPSPTEVINTGRSEVLGSINLIAFSSGVTGTSTGGQVQIGVIYANGVQIDNTTTTGIRIFTSGGFASAGPTVISVENLSITGRCAGFLTINIPGGYTVAPGDYIRVEGVRGRIDMSDGIVAGTDLYAQLQSINDPSATQFEPETIRVAKSLPGMTVNVVDDSVLLCFPSYGVSPSEDADYPDYYIRISEGFVRAFVAEDSNAAGADITDRVDTSGDFLGSPTTGTQFRVALNSIPASVASISWGGPYYANQGTTSWLQLVPGSTTFVAGTAGNPNGYALATFEYYTNNQVGFSDVTLESFNVKPLIVLSNTNQVDTGNVLAGVALYPVAESLSGCSAPTTIRERPRFLLQYQSSGGVTSTDYRSTSFDVYASLIRCNCFLLFTYVTKGSFFNTGIAIANTSGDTEVFGSNGAPKQSGPITFYFYDSTAAFVGATTTTTSYAPGQSFVSLLSNILPTGVTSFSGYIIAQAQFQFCHGYAFIADSNFATIAQGYLANVIPDPAILGGRMATGPGLGGIPAGELLNN